MNSGRTNRAQGHYTPVSTWPPEYHAIQREINELEAQHRQWIRSRKPERKEMIHSTATRLQQQRRRLSKIRQLSRME